MIVRAGAFLGTTFVLLATVLIFAAPAGAAEYELESVSASLSTNQAGARADLTISFELTEEGNKPLGFTRAI